MAKRSYEVCGSQAVLGHEPGSTFSADLTDEREKFLLDGGHLRKNSAPAKKSGAAKKSVTPKKGEKPASDQGGEPKEKK